MSLKDPKSYLPGLSYKNREEFIENEYDITKHELRMIQSKSSNIDKIENTCELLLERGHRDEINAFTLGFILYPDCKCPKKIRDRVYSTVCRNGYKEKTEKISEKLEVDIPIFQIFREEIGAYQGNWREALFEYDNVSFSNSDLYNDIQIPLDIEVRESELLGSFWADGSLQDTNLYLRGSQNDFEFYSILANRIESVFNYDAEIYNIREDPNLPKIEISSRAITDWLRDAVGFKENKENLKIPDLNDSELMKSFLSGVLSAGCHLKNGSGLFITQKEEKWLQGIQKLCNEYEIKEEETPDKDTFTIEFDSDETREALEKGLITNPYLLRELRG